MAAATPETPQKQDSTSGRVPPSDEVRKHEIAELEKQGANPTGVEPKPIYDTPGNEPSSAGDLYRREAESTEANVGEPASTQEPAKTITNTKHEGQLGSGYRGKGDDQSRFAFLRNASLRKKILGGGGITAILVSLLIFFLTALPLKIIGIVENLKDQYFSTSQNAISKETENMFSKYLKKEVFQGLNPANCPSTRASRSCVAPITGTDPISRTWDGWRQGRLENKLYDNYKIEFAKGSDGKIRLKAPSLDSNGVLIDPDPTKNIFDQPGLNRGEFRQQLRDALSNETRFKQAWIYFKMGGLLEKKYGIKRCVVACKPKDTIADTVQNKKLAGKAYLAERVLTPRSEMMSLVMQCVLMGGDCDPDKTHPSDGNNGEHTSDWEDGLRTKLQEYRLKYGNDSLRELIRTSKAISEKGYSRYATEAIIEKAFNGTISDAAKQNIANAVPVIGWINGIVHTVDFLKTAGPKLQKMTYVVNSTTMAATFSMIGTAADEIKAGVTDSAAVGSVTDLLNPGKDGPGAEASPLYAALIDHKKSPAVAESTAPSNLLSGIANAAGIDKTKTYTCNDGQPVKADKLVCPEEDLAHVSSLTDGAGKVSGFLNLPVIGDTLDVAINAWKTVTGPLKAAIEAAAGFAGDALVPQFVKDAISKAAQPFMDFITEKLIPSIASDTMSGARTFNLAAGGADVSGNDFAHHSLGGKELTPQQRKAVVADQHERDDAEFNNKSLYAKLFDTSDTRSLASRTAMAMPSDGSIASLVSSIGKNPLGKIFSSLSLPFSHAYAAPANLPSDPFSVTQYGYPVNDPIFDTDPQQYWNDHCTNNAQTDTWNNAATRNDSTGNLENDTTNPCLLLETAADSAGAIFPGGLAEQDQNGGDNNAQAGTPGLAAGATIDLATLTQSSVSIACAGGTKDLGTQTGYTNGQPVPIKLCAIPGFPSTGEESNGGFGVTGAGGNVVVNSRVSGAVLAMVQAAKQDGVNLTAISSFRTMSHQQSLCPCDGVHVAVPGTSNHQMGLAIDFGGGLPSTPGPIPGNQFWTWLSNNASKFGYKNYPAEAWHWSPTGN